MDTNYYDMYLGKQGGEVCWSKGGSFFLLQVITYKCDGELQKQVGRKDLSVFFFSRVEKKRGGKSKVRSSWTSMYFLSLNFNFGQCIADVSSRPRFFFPSEGKKNGKSHSGEVGRRSYVITSKKNDPPLAGGSKRRILTYPRPGKPLLQRKVSSVGAEFGFGGSP